MIVFICVSPLWRVWICSGSFFVFVVSRIGFWWLGSAMAMVCRRSFFLLFGLILMWNGCFDRFLFFLSSSFKWRSTYCRWNDRRILWEKLLRFHMRRTWLLNELLLIFIYIFSDKHINTRIFTPIFDFNVHTFIYTPITCIPIYSHTHAPIIHIYTETEFIFFSPNFMRVFFFSKCEFPWIIIANTNLLPKLCKQINALLFKQPIHRLNSRQIHIGCSGTLWQCWLHSASRLFGGGTLQTYEALQTLQSTETLRRGCVC